MEGKGGKWKALLRGDSQPSQPALKHPGGNRSRALVVALGDVHSRALPTPHRWLLMLRHYYFWLSQLLCKGWFSASFTRPCKAVSGMLGDQVGPPAATSLQCPSAPRGQPCPGCPPVCIRWELVAALGQGRAGAPLPGLQLDVGLHGEGAETKCYFESVPYDFFFL